MREQNSPGLTERLSNPNGPLVVTWLVAINVIIFVIGLFWQAPTGHGSIPMLQLYGAFSEYTCYTQGSWWQLITYQFLHAHLGHILFNMIALWFFGPTVERRFGHWRFLFYYLYCGVAAAIFYTVLGSLGVFGNGWQYATMVGASGSIYGVMAACAVLFPHGRVQLLFPPINLSVRQFALVVLGIACAVILFQWNNAGGEAGHLGGMFAGFALTLLILLREKIEAFAARHSSTRRNHPSPQSRLNIPVAPYDHLPAPTEAEVNAVMNKIARSGLASLTPEEHSILQRAARR